MNYLKTLKKRQIKQLAGFFIVIVGFSLIFLIASCRLMRSDKRLDMLDWVDAIKRDAFTETKAAELSESAVRVDMGASVENIKNISLKDSKFSASGKVWFNWEGDDPALITDSLSVKNGELSKLRVLEQRVENGKCYLLMAFEATVYQNLWTVRFPLESQRLQIEMVSTRPVSELMFISGETREDEPKQPQVPAYKVEEIVTGTRCVSQSSTYGNARKSQPDINSSFVISVHLNRANWGLYLKCFIALFGTSIWVLIALYLATYHRVDPIGLLPAALLGTVTNILVGANLLPDALKLGLLEFVNFWGIYTTIIVTVIIIMINRIRNHDKDAEFAAFFGRVMFAAMLIVVIGGHIAMPAAAFVR